MDSFLADVVKWADKEQAIDSMLLVGSHARGTQRPDSDVDIVILTADKACFINDVSFASQFGEISRLETEEWGILTALRVFYKNGLEVEFGFAPLEWMGIPVPEGTDRVLRDGYRVLIDKNDRFRNVEFSQHNALNTNVPSRQEA